MSGGDGQFGDCYRACIATILDLPSEEVPNFGHLAGGSADGDGDKATDLARAWLAERGLGTFKTWVNGEWSIEKLLNLFSRDNPGVPWILHGEARHKGPGDFNHSVVCLDGEIAHDPSGAGILGPCVDISGERPWWWVEVLAIGARHAA